MFIRYRVSVYTVDEKITMVGWTGDTCRDMQAYQTLLYVARPDIWGSLGVMREQREIAT
jgi:hypothetical protein